MSKLIEKSFVCINLDGGFCAVYIMNPVNWFGSFDNSFGLRNHDNSNYFWRSRGIIMPVSGTPRPRTAPAFSAFSLLSPSSDVNGHFGQKINSSTAKYCCVMPFKPPLYETLCQARIRERSAGYPFYSILIMQTYGSRQGLIGGAKN